VRGWSEHCLLTGNDEAELEQQLKRGWQPLKTQSEQSPTAMQTHESRTNGRKVRRAKDLWSLLFDDSASRMSCGSILHERVE
jgi:hypothetical protein